KERLPSLPNVPTTAEAGYPQVNATSWFALFAPANTPKPVVDKLVADVRTVVQSPAFQQKAQEQGATADYQAPQQLGARVKSDLANWAQVIKAANIQAE
ncbi:tripartite tricarboxylate transporter substrate binding protein, partial [Rhizobium leguminosarum]|uniref:Bug family tripartite tricarboxylate transporter substrate binding protein n=3 Tax=Pseudomonadota TaxID=1224 RepID=UPI0013B74767